MDMSEVPGGFADDARAGGKEGKDGREEDKGGEKRQDKGADTKHKDKERGRSHYQWLDVVHDEVTLNSIIQMNPFSEDSAVVRAFSVLVLLPPQIHTPSRGPLRYTF